MVAQAIGQPWLFVLLPSVQTSIFQAKWWETPHSSRVGFCSKRTCIFRGIQFTKHSIKFVLVESNQLFSIDSNVVLTRQTCGQRSGMAAASKRRALAFYFSVRICYMFLISKRRRESYLGLYMTSGFAKRMPLRSANFRL